MGIITIVLSKGQIPVFWGVAHQGGAILLLSIALYLMFLSKKEQAEKG